MKKTHYFKQMKTLVAIFISCCLCVMSASHAAADEGKIHVSGAEQTKNEMPENVKVTIHTYGDDVYVVTGRLEIPQSGDEEKETVLEIQGSIKKIEDTEINASYEHLKRAASTALTVYAGNEIYGFYSSYEMIGKPGADQELMIYGYLEGYSDGIQHYSS